MEVKLTADKTTGGGKTRFSDSDHINIYLTAEEVKELGNPKVIKITIVKET